ncbi:MAG: hypothetical protein ACI3VE_06275 [Oscillospiraceae bacterium]
MKFHKKLGVFEACKKVRQDFFDTMKYPDRGICRDILFVGFVSRSNAFVNEALAARGSAPTARRNKKLPSVRMAVGM